LSGTVVADSDERTIVDQQMWSMLFRRKNRPVPGREHLDEIETALKAGGNTDYTITHLPALNHLFQTIKTGLPAEYSQIEETIAPRALDVIGQWIEKRFH